jgi:hypothetical protein
VSGVIPKGQWYWQKREKERAMREALASGWGIRGVACGERLIPLPKPEPSVAFGPPLLSSGISMDLVRSRFPDRRNDPTPAHHIERHYHPRSIAADLVI